MACALTHPTGTRANSHAHVVDQCSGSVSFDNADCEAINGQQRGMCRYVQWADGSQEWEGLPEGLHNKLLGRATNLPRVQAISCGAHGEWFVRFWDGQWRANSIPDNLNKTMDTVHEDGGEVVVVEFGSSGSWVLLHTVE